MAPRPSRPSAPPPRARHPQALLVAAVLFASSSLSAVELEVVQTIRLAKRSGSVDQVLPLADGGFAVRDYTWDPPEAQRIELFAPDGSRRSAISAYGHGAGKYVRLSGLAVDSRGGLWVADFGAARLTLYRPNGEVARTVLLQNPSFRPKAVALDEDRKRLFVAGCHPRETYLDLGCLLVHQYALDTGKFVGSFVESDPEAVARRWEGRVDYDLTVDDQGLVYLVAEASFKVVRLEPESGRVEVWPVASAIAKPPPALDIETVTSQGGKDAGRKEAFLVDHVAAAGAHIVVSIARPGRQGYLLEVFDRSGHQVAKDVPAPGRLVGATANGAWIFTRRNQDRFELVIARLGKGS